MSYLQKINYLLSFLLYDFQWFAHINDTHITLVYLNSRNISQMYINL